MSRTKKVGFVGAGNMAGALIRGVLEARLYRAGELWVTDPLPAQRRRIRRSYGVDAASDNRQLVRGSQMIVLAVKRNGDMQFNPGPDDRMNAGDYLIAIGESAGLRKLEEAAGK